MLLSFVNIDYIFPEKKLYLSDIVFVYILSIFNKYHRKYLKMCDNVN